MQKPEDFAFALANTFQRLQIVDLTHTLEEHMPTYWAHSKYFHTLWESYWHGDTAVVYQLIMSEHVGTHVDAPAHFKSDSSHPAHYWIDKVGLEKLIGPCVKIDCVDQSPRSLVSKKQLQAWEDKYVSIKKGTIVIFNFGWHKYWALRPHGKKYLKDYPGISREVAEYLVDIGVKAVGTDAIGLDAYGTTEFPAHYVLLPSEVLIIENLTNLDSVPVSFFFMAFPLKIKDGSGSPIRALALIEK